MDLFWTLPKNFNRLSKMCNYLSRETSSEEKFFVKKINSLINFQKSSGVFLENLKKMDFRQRFISTVIINGFYISREIFWGKNMFPEKNQLEKSLYTSSAVLFSFVDFVWPVYQKRVLVCRWTFWDKSVFRTKTFLRLFSELTRKIVVLWQRIFYLLTKVRFICLEEFFGRVSFSEKNINS